jgi:hypothetical protein
MPFEPEAGGVAKAWQSRPRMLIAAGFSKSNPTASVECPPRHDFDPASKGEATSSFIDLHLTGPEYVKQDRYAIKLDLLGLRNAVPSSSKLLITSYWERKNNVSLTLTPEELPNPNLMPKGDVGGTALEELPNKTLLPPKYADLKKRINSLYIISESEEDREMMLDKEREEDQDEEEPPAHVPVVTIDDFVGAQIRVPTYTVPVIPYLQRNEQQITVVISEMAAHSFSRVRVQPYNDRVLKIEGIEPRSQLADWNQKNPDAKVSSEDKIVKVNGVEGSSELMHQELKAVKQLTITVLASRGVSVEWEGKLEVVLMPDIMFTVRNFMGVLGSLSVPLGPILRQQQIWDRDKKEQIRSAAELHGLDERGKHHPATGKEYRPRHVSRAMSSIKHMGDTEAAKLPELQGVTVTEDCYKVFVDVFVAKSGYLSFHPGLALGRCLDSQVLFNTTPDLDMDDDDKKDREEK